MRKWAVVAPDAPLVCLDCTTPVPSGTEILLEVTHCGVCHSDLHFWHGTFDLGGGQILNITDRGVKLPCAPGHEIVGRVAALGPDASGVAVGDRRVVYPWMGCRTCELCRTDRENLCYQSNSLGTVRDGGFASHVLVPDASYLFDYEGVDLLLAATLACSGITVFSAVAKLRALDKDKPILLIGAGGLGLLAIAMLRSSGHRNILVVDASPEKASAALQAGATHAFDTSRDDLASAILQAAGGLLLSAIDFVNRPQTVGLALECLGKQGRLVLVGVGGGAYALSLASLIFRPRAIIGTITGSRQDLRDTIALARSGALSAVRLTGMPKDQTNEAMIRLRDGHVIGRLVLEDAGNA
jgi:alcohol dehydrogenase/propanol-preferring alcohol dehydrogenase